MKKNFRVKKNEEFQEIISYKKYVVSKEFAMYYKKNQQKHMRVGISVSKKLGNAVVRNKIKRQVREIMRELFDYQVPYDIIIIVRYNYLNNEFQQNKQCLHDLFLKMKARLMGEYK